ncbi:MAG: glycoside hydrolase family 3 C-terminal domain-containing protein [Lachnospiraceae bacterium]|nr:glycoside hydrolase family 3 C-terminal domain-containing protein [Lachnospiraceae bacterium]
MRSGTKTVLKKTAVTLSAILFGFSVMATDIAMANNDTVTSALGQSNAKVVQLEGDENVDLEHGYRSGYNSIQEVVAGGFEIQERQEAEGAVLLKNDNGALPLEKGAKVSVFGITGAVPFYGASGSGGINTSEAIGWYDAFRGKYHDRNHLLDLAQGDAILNINEKLAQSYTVWTDKEAEGYNADYVPSSSTTKVNIGDVPWNVLQKADGFSDVSTYGDAAIYIIKRTGGEGYDLPATSGKNAQYGNTDYAAPSENDGVYGDYLQLSETEISVLNGLKDLKDQGTVKKIVLILNMASTIQLDFLKNDVYGIDAALWVGSVGEVGTVAVAKLLTGEYNFSAGASATLWTDHLMNPVNNNFTDQNYFFTYPNYEEFGFMNPALENSYQSTMTTYMVYQEGMYLGYKYTETRYEDYVMGTANAGDYDYDGTVAYPFGFGLSYTTFSFGKPSVQKDGANYNVTVEVTNTGKVAGKSPVQIYIAKPYGDYAKKNDIQVPSVELIDFGKTGMLNPGQSEKVTVSVSEKYFTSYDTFGAGTYVIMPGDYYLIAAANAHDAVNHLLAAKGYTPSSTGNRMDAEGDAGMAHKLTYSLDAQTYSVSTATGNPIHNIFDFVDINTYEGRGSNSVTYYSRDNWAAVPMLSRNADGSLVKNNAKLTMTKTMADELRDQMDAGKEIEKGGEYPTYGAQNGLVLVDLEGLSYENPLWDDLLDQLTWDETVDLLSNGRHKTQAIESVSKPGTGDENGPNGLSQRYNEASGGGRFNGPTNPYADRIDDPDLGQGYTTTGFSSNGVMAASFNKALSEEVGRQVGEEGYWAGMAGLLGGGFNIQRSPYAGRTAEYYSEDAMLTGLIGAPFTKGLESMGVHSFAKHCALNESETGRHGVQEWISEQAFRENYLRAFEIVFIDGGAFNTMTAFNRIGTIAVANSRVFAQNWLRNEIGLPGIVETDAAGDMTDGAHGEAYVSRIVNVYTQASDLNEYNYAADAPDYTGSSYTYASFAPTSAGGPGGYGTLAQSMRESAKRILYAGLNSNAICGYTSNVRVVRVTPPWETAIKIVDVILGLCFLASVAWFVIDGIKTRKKAKAA